MLALTGFGFGSLAALFLISWRDFRHLRVGKVFILIILASVAYLMDPLAPAHWRWLTSDLQTALPALFWVLCQLVFASRPRLLSVWGAMALYSFAAPALSTPFIEAGHWSDLGVFLGLKLGQWFEYVVVLHGVIYVVRHWRNDLVEARRKLRLALLLILGSAVGTATISLNFGIYPEATRGMIVGLASLAILFCIISSRDVLLELTPSEQSVECEQQPEPEACALVDAPRQVDSDDGLKLEELMKGGFYKREKLALKQLADALGIPEYRVRRLINQKLGYRNFSDYINHLRIAEASSRLIDTPDEPVLNISLDVGYRTLSSFNRAFREIMNTTPTAFRHERSLEQLQAGEDPGVKDLLSS
ncbi:helix-turn-helix domain-containing protein [Marinobacter sp. KMM 10035]|uniref:AraC family transcriptional regulator n=1 Tax=Marinobacter sp. KMM 10035 TaxID=3134034 RepID=UPI00397D09AD